MRFRRGVAAGLMLGVVWAMSAATVAEAKIYVVPPRPGQLGAGIQGQFGSLTKGGGLGSEFGTGPGLAVRVRYRMRYERALGLSFESQRFDIRHKAPPESLFADRSATLLNTSAEFYQLFGTRSNTTRMLSVGFGLTQLSKKLNDGETKLGGNDVSDGAFLSVGAGIEKFVYQSLGIDLNTHYQAIFQNKSTNHNIAVSLGLIFYASY